MTRSKAELLVDCRNTLGEMPRWDAAGGTLLWIDVVAPGRLFQLHTPSLATDILQFEHALTSLATCAASTDLLLAGEREIWRLDRQRREKHLLFTLPPDQPMHRFNDGAIDRAGRFWIGSMPNNLREPLRSAARLESSGRLFAIGEGGAERSFDEGFACPNAICWSPDGSLLYVADSVSQWIYAYDFDVDAGTVSGRREFCRLDGLGIPDGAAVDSAGYIWNARWGAGVVARIDPCGRLAQTVELPVTNPTACCFGGSRHDVLYVTSARYGLSSQQLASEPLAGSVFAIATTTPGLPAGSFTTAACGNGVQTTKQRPSLT
jgi:sugar lactone lactonase YvrE